MKLGSFARIFVLLAEKRECCVKTHGVFFIKKVVYLEVNASNWTFLRRQIVTFLTN